MSTLPLERRFRIASLLILGVVAAASVQMREDSRIVEAAPATDVIEIPSTLEVDAAAEVERINADGFHPFVAGDR